jgi:hypothetical protein
MAAAAAAASAPISLPSRLGLGQAFPDGGRRRSGRLAGRGVEWSASNEASSSRGWSPAPGSRHGRRRGGERDTTFAENIPNLDLNLHITPYFLHIAP